MVESLNKLRHIKENFDVSIGLQGYLEDLADDIEEEILNLLDNYGIIDKMAKEE